MTVTFGRYEKAPFETPNMSAPRFTVISTAHNRGFHIERTICSVLDQGFNDTQYIVVDRGSDDGTNQVAAIYGDKLTLIGAPGANHTQTINRGLAVAEGEFVIVVDDLLMPGALHEAERVITTHGVDWIVGQCTRINEDDFATDRIDALDPPSFGAMLMHDSPSLPLFGTFLRRSLIQSTGLFDDRLSHAYGYEYWCRLMSRGLRPRIIGPTIGGYREGEAPGAHSLVAHGLEMIEVARRYGRFLPLRQQVELWRNCDRRQRIYALAEAELAPVTARRKLVQQIVRRPWWIMHDHVRQTLVNGVTHPLPDDQRDAA